MKTKTVMRENKFQSQSLKNGPTLHNIQKHRDEGSQQRLSQSRRLTDYKHSSHTHINTRYHGVKLGQVSCGKQFSKLGS